MKLRQALILGLISGLLLAGCNTELAPYLGYWNGGFVPEQGGGLQLRGYVQLYQSGNKFQMEFANPVQSVSLKGTWKIGRNQGSNQRTNQAVLHATSISVTQLPLEKLKALKVPYLTTSAFETAFREPLILQLASNGKSLDSSLITLGPGLGHYHFAKGETRIGPTGTQ